MFSLRMLLTLFVNARGGLGARALVIRDKARATREEKRSIGSALCVRDRGDYFDEWGKGGASAAGAIIKRKESFGKARKPFFKKVFE